MPMVAVVAQNRFRLFQTLMLLRTSQTPAARVVQALAEDIVAKRRSGAGDTKSWAAVVRDTLTSVRETTGLTRIPVASSPTRVHLVSARIGRLYAYHKERSALVRAGASVTCDRPFGCALDRDGLIALCAAMHDFGHFDTTPVLRAERNAAVLGLQVAKTPASVWGAGFLGSPLESSMRIKSRQCTAVVRARFGVATMMSWPFAASARERAENAADDDDGDADEGAPQGAGAATGEGALLSFAQSRQAARDPCTLCSRDEDGPACDVWHLLFECTDPHIMEHQLAIRRSAEHMLALLCKQYVAAARRAEPRDEDDDGGGRRRQRGGDAAAPAAGAAAPAMPLVMAAAVPAAASGEAAAAAVAGSMPLAAFAAAATRAAVGVRPPAPPAPPLSLFAALAAEAAAISAGAAVLPPAPPAPPLSLFAVLAAEAAAASAGASSSLPVPPLPAPSLFAELAAAAAEPAAGGSAEPEEGVVAPPPVVVAHHPAARVAAAMAAGGVASGAAAAEAGDDSGGGGGGGGDGGGDGAEDGSRVAVVTACSAAILQMIQQGIDWDTLDARHVLYRLVLVIPFSAADVRGVKSSGGSSSRRANPPPRLVTRRASSR